MTRVVSSVLLEAGPLRSLCCELTFGLHKPAGSHPCRSRDPNEPRREMVCAQPSHPPATSRRAEHGGLVFPLGSLVRHAHRRDRVEKRYSSTPRRCPPCPAPQMDWHHPDKNPRETLPVFRSHGYYISPK